MPSVRLSRPLLFLGIAGALLSQSAASHAQQDPLSAICEGFLSSSGAPSPRNSTVLCGCLVQEVQANLNLAEMQAYQRATEARQPLPPAVQSKIMAIAAKCLG